jgi:predicted dehydrogenase
VTSGASPLRLAVIGVGWAGTRQTESVRELGSDKLKVVCLVDPDADFLAARSKELGVERTCTDLSDVLCDPDIDAVTICSPHPFHCAQAVAAAEAGKHVLVEKPMAMDVDEATRMIDAAEAARVCLYVAESAVYQPIASFLRDVVRSGRWIGELTSASVTAGFRAPIYGYPDRRAWLAKPELGGRGTWTLHGIHTVAQLRYVLGEVAVVYARQHRAASFQRQDVEATVSAALTLVSGVTVHLLQTAETKMPAALATCCTAIAAACMHTPPAADCSRTRRMVRTSTSRRRGTPNTLSNWRLSPTRWPAPKARRRG